MRTDCDSTSAERRWRDGSGFDLTRRHALKLLAGSMAFALSSCGPPEEEIVPYVDQPGGVTPGVPLYFATALPLAGYARGVLATSYEGRPTKIEGNPRHPASFGATDVFGQAEIMSLYEPDRSQAVHNSGWACRPGTRSPRRCCRRWSRRRRGTGRACAFSPAASPRRR